MATGFPQMTLDKETFFKAACLHLDSTFKVSLAALWLVLKGSGDGIQDDVGI